jgi:hypothetical protein
MKIIQTLSRTSERNKEVSSELKDFAKTLNTKLPAAFINHNFFLHGLEKV